MLSKERLVPYERNVDGPQFIINKYNENILFCEAMYPVLDYFEVLLRTDHQLSFGIVINQSDSIEWLTPKILQVPVGWI
ncbi:MAG: hypothetical protein K0R76_298 [Alphaproteobacteria bacterium]|nr:hypothetical protein [Alphaproteobacteria bacterium]